MSKLNKLNVKYKIRNLVFFGKRISKKDRDASMFIFSSKILVILIAITIDYLFLYEFFSLYIYVLNPNNQVFGNGKLIKMRKNIFEHLSETLHHIFRIMR
ncbi:hypothetical protein BpHYR1_044232 [Brachionus plicatilis]|uniref:Uncharacterized protein n=1 Tax=Brachionus plicatilis TaxID=10195 RepID=A0A3M7SWN2_BRAPC|nr:hypothetical protein BpHYR1_044232 [Brachionus plicatilis]